MAKLSHKEVDYGRGHLNGDHCAICEHYEPPHCEIVVDPISWRGWCKKFRNASEELERRLAERDK